MSQSPGAHLDFTGERVVANATGEAAEQSLYTIHQAIYRWIAQCCQGQAVFDMGCGTGHGTHLLSQYTPHVWGADLGPDAVRFAAAQYPALRQRSFVSDATHLSLLPACFDAVVAVEIIEHVESDHAFLAEMQRIVRPQGLCYISTPNRLVHSPGRSVPLNPFHVREYTYEEWLALLQGYFRQVTVLGVVIQHRGFLIRYHQSQGIQPVLTFPLSNIERFLYWHAPIWKTSAVAPEQVAFVEQVPPLCWGFLAVCADPQ